MEGECRVHRHESGKRGKKAKRISKRKEEEEEEEEVECDRRGTKANVSGEKEDDVEKEGQPFRSTRYANRYTIERWMHRSMLPFPSVIASRVGCHE